MKYFCNDIETLTKQNTNYRKVLLTSKHSQLVLMHLKPNEEIGMETHEDGDQFIKIESGVVKAILNGDEHILFDGGAISIPEGTKHNIINISDKDPVKLYSVYSPPHHPDKLVQKNKPKNE
jgi:mannose-6-phosphate isomerase-like protein (cupin superfamily)